MIWQHQAELGDVRMYDVSAGAGEVVVLLRGRPGPGTAGTG